MNGINEAWLVVDRVVAMRGGSPLDEAGEAGNIEYLVKWKELGYDMCRWARESAAFTLVPQCTPPPARCE